MADPAYFTDRTCIVTGANSGIGFALSEELLIRGATVYLLGRNPHGRNHVLNLQDRGIRVAHGTSE